MSIVLGGTNSRVVCRSGSREVVFDLPLTNLDGRLIETYEEEKIRHYVQSLSIASPSIRIREQFLGYRITWSFSYNSFIDGEDVVKFDKIDWFAHNDYTITLFPRMDEEWRFFDVIPDNESTSLGITKGGRLAQFNTDFNYRFVTPDLVQDRKLKVVVIPPSGITGYIAYTLDNLAIQP